MDIIIQNKRRLGFKITLNSNLLIGAQNYYENTLERREGWVYTPPKALKLHVQCNGNIDLFNALRREAPRFSDYGVIVTIANPRKVTTVKLKPEYEYIDRRKKCVDLDRITEGEKLLKKLAELNIEVDVKDYHRYETPPEYIESVREDLDYQNAGLCFVCHSGTPFYQTMYREGIIDQAIPSWYREGYF